MESAEPDEADEPEPAGAGVAEPEAGAGAEVGAASFDPEVGSEAATDEEP